MVTTLEERVELLETRVKSLESRLQNGRRPAFGVTVEEVRARMGQPVVRGPEQFEKLRQAIGSFSGPRDLSERMRDYLYGDYSGEKE